MVFTEVAWTNGDTITETKLDQMVASDVYVREEANYYHLVNEAAEFTATYGSGTESHTVQLLIDGSAVGSSESGNGDHNVSDIDLAAVADGLHTISIYLNSTVSGGDVTVTWRFYKSPDLDYLTWWATAARTDDGLGNYINSLSAMTIIGHRQIKTWT